MDKWVSWLSYIITLPTQANVLRTKNLHWVSKAFSDYYNTTRVEVLSTKELLVLSFNKCYECNTKKKKYYSFTKTYRNPLPRNMYAHFLQPFVIYVILSSIMLLNMYINVGNQLIIHPLITLSVKKVLYKSHCQEKKKLFKQLQLWLTKLKKVHGVLISHSVSEVEFKQEWECTK